MKGIDEKKRDGTLMYWREVGEEGGNIEMKETRRKFNLCTYRIRILQERLNGS